MRSRRPASCCPLSQRQGSGGVGELGSKGADGWSISEPGCLVEAGFVMLAGRGRFLSVRYGRVVKHESENLYALSKGN